MTRYEMINQIKELQTQTESLREGLTNLTTKLLVEPDPKKKSQFQTNKTEHPKKSNKIKIWLKQ